MRRHDHKPGARNGILTSVIATSVVIAASIVAATPRTGVSSPHAVSSLGAGVPLIPRLADSAELASAPRKLALIVAVSRQGTPPPGTRANSTLEGAANAADLMRAALQYHKFDSIAVIQDEDATKDGILEALEAHLINPARAGDVTLFYYAGHGGQIADDDGDEEREDRMDEVLVPYGAPDPRTESTSDMGQYYIRDDELGTLLDRLLARVGPTGQVVAFLDACHSGTGTRGLPASGGSLPQGAVSNSYVGSGYHEPRNQTDGIDRGVGETGFITMSAGRQFDIVIETEHTDGRLVSPLAHALDWALPKLGPRSSFRDLHDLVTEIAHAENWHHPPQVEGPATQVVFKALGTHYQPWVRVDSIVDSLTLSLSGGELHGLRTNSVIELHAPGTAGPPRSETFWARGTVISASALGSRIRLDTHVPDVAMERGRVYVTHEDLGDMSTKFAIHEDVDSGIAARLRRTLSQHDNVIDFDPDAPDVVVQQRGTTFQLQTAIQGTPIGPSIATASAGAAVELSNILLGYARYAYLRRLHFTDNTLAVSLRLIPAIRHERLGCRPDTTNVSSAIRKTDRQGLEWEVQYNQLADPIFMLQVRHEGTRRAYLAIIDFLPQGVAKLLYPTATMSPTSARLDPGDERSFCYTMAPLEGDPPRVPGLEVLKLFATNEALDFRPYVTAAAALRSRGGATRGSSRDSSTYLGGILNQMFGILPSERDQSRMRGWRRPTKINVSSVRLRVDL